MGKVIEQLIIEVEAFFKQKKYADIISLLNDGVLQTHNNAVLYVNVARAHAALGQILECLTYVDKTIELDPKFALGYSLRGYAKSAQKEHLKAIDDYTTSISLNKNQSHVYFNRGNSWRNLNEHKKAIKDYSQAIKLRPDDSEAYVNRGTSWYLLNEYTKAIEDYSQAIKLQPDFPKAYCNRGVSWRGLNDHDKAIADYSKAIELNDKYADAYYNRAFNYAAKENYQGSINDYLKYIELTNDNEDYYTKTAYAQIAELKKKLKDKWYNEIDVLVKGIKRLLLFKEDCITHYTSLSGAKAMVLDGSKFRLSEGTFLNDPSEGSELFKFLSFSTVKTVDHETIAETFVEKPFIGSFVAGNKHNDLTLWRMYGKEAQAEAKGCALTIHRERFINSLKQSLSPSGNKSDNVSGTDGNFTFYKVAYRANDKFIIPGADSNNNKINKLLQTLKTKVGSLNEDQKIDIKKSLNEIAFLFKTNEYQYEYEVRLVVDGIGFKKNTIVDGDNKPKVSINLIDIVPVLHKITLGPKVERADEWASAFNYHIKEKQESSSSNNTVEIIISHLPFK